MQTSARWLYVVGFVYQVYTMIFYYINKKKLILSLELTQKRVPKGEKSMNIYGL